MSEGTEQENKGNQKKEREGKGRKRKESKYNFENQVRQHRLNNHFWIQIMIWVHTLQDPKQTT